ncbi:CRISPR-associated endoribonuclease Cas6 [Thermanaeromonas toyohensis ToBE]|uniref:CRISPR-associated endoribonuclease Cas6 n=1 Tax=Thermanaeromonas toyohensis ToBE TaxID=698762 RepID=A0A1W1VRS1_9FIRM|nr:CRISPR-associated endoribonuclease Cas6 [Thermanaeromonas toyohensis]SMB96059.1 CRISPR-associated endoribonuclease Cas6 [Thermanaeromonas toyohensis ToBE]
MVLPKSRIVTVMLSKPGARIPWCWRDYVQPWLYGFIDDGGRVHTAKYSLFTFSFLPVGPVFTPEGLGSQNGVWVFRFASALPWVLEMVSRGVQKSRTVKIGNAVLKPAVVTEEPLSRRATYQTGAPVLAAKLKERGFWTPREREFADAVARSLTNRWAYLTGNEVSPESIRFEFLGSVRQKLVQYRGRNLLAFSGIVRLGAPDEMLTFAQCVGLGQKPSCGFGFII